MRIYHPKVLDRFISHRLAVLMFSSACPDVPYFPALFIFARPCLFRYCGHGSLPLAASLRQHVPTCWRAGQLRPALLPFCPPATLCSSSNALKSSSFYVDAVCGPRKTPQASRLLCQCFCFAQFPACVSPPHPHSLVVFMTLVTGKR